MKSVLKFFFVSLLAVVCAGILLLAKEKQKITDGVIRLHVVGASNSEFDQAVKLEVRDAVLETVSRLTEGASCKEETQKILADNLDVIQSAADGKLSQLGCEEQTDISLCEEKFSTRHYDTFSLPAGVYDSLRITIGPGEGRNWWCVVFPSFCVSATSDEFRDKAVAAGFTEESAMALAGEYEIRFFLLDCMGAVENFLFDLQ